MYRNILKNVQRTISKELIATLQKQQQILIEKTNYEKFNEQIPNLLEKRML